MSEMPPEQGDPQAGGGNFLTRKYMGIPGIVWMGGAAVLAYFLFFRNKSGSSAATPSETGGTINLNVPTGTKGRGFNTNLGSTAYNPANNGIDPGQPQVSGAINPQPTPVTPGLTAVNVSNMPSVAKPAKTTFTFYTVQKGDTLASIAKKFGITVQALASNNVYVPGEVAGNKKVGQPLGTGAGLKTGQVLKIPHTSLGYSHRLVVRGRKGLS